MNKNIKLLEISNITPYIDEGFTGQGWRFTTLETLNKKHKHAEYTIETYKVVRPDAEFVRCPIKNAWSVSNINKVIDWAIDENIKTILISLNIALNSIEFDIFNKAVERAIANDIFIANAAGNENKDITNKKDMSTVKLIDTISAIYYNSAYDRIMRANYSNHGEPVDYTDFAGVWLDKYDMYFKGTSCASPFFQGKRDIIREVLQGMMIEAPPYEIVREVIDENLIDLGEKGEDNMFGKGLLRLPQMEYFNKYVKEEADMRYGFPFKNIEECVITSTFGRRKDPITGEEQIHGGVDIVSTGDTKVIASNDGEVVIRGYTDTFGNRLYIKNEFDDIEIIYAHLDKMFVKIGDKVNQGQVIGTMGNTGHSTGAHLHFELRRGRYPNHVSIEPTTWLGLNDKTGPVKYHWAEKDYEELNEVMEVSDRRFDDTITRGEAIALINKYRKGE